MEFVYGQSYPRKQLLAVPGGTTEYQDASSQFVRTEQGIRFLGQIGVPPSWYYQPTGEFPYLHLPDSLWVSIHTQHWVGKPLVPRFKWLDELPDSEQVDDPVWGRRDGVVGCALNSRLERIEAFGCNDASDELVYLGQGWVGSYGGAHSEPESWRICYRLATPISREMWLRFGGYTSWLLVIEDREFTITSYEEAVPLINTFWGNIAPDLRLTRFEGDTLWAGITPQQRAGVWYQARDCDVVYSGQNGDEWDRVDFGDADDSSMPVSRLISREQALAIIEAFMTTGQPVGLPGFPR